MKKSKLALEKEVFEIMTLIYCKGSKHGSVPCESCSKIIAYAGSRTDACIFGEDKGFCSKCKVHCFKPEMRAEVKKIMRYSGRRMLFHHPMMAIRHMLRG